MATRVCSLLLLLALATTATAQIFDLDERIRPRPDTGRFILPGPFDTDALFPITAGGVLEGCEATYAFCDPAPVSCAEPPCCGEQSPDPGDTLRVGRPALIEDRPTLVGVNVMAGGACYGEGQQAADVLYFNLGGFAGPPSDCFACTVGLLLFAAGFIDCPGDCFGNEVAAGFFCSLFDEGSGELFHAAAPRAGVRPRAISGAFTPTLRTLRDGVMAPADAGRHYIALYEAHSPELIRVTPRRPWLVWMIADALEAWQPAFAALAGGNGASVVITPQMIADMEAILDELATEAAPATQAAIATERTRLDPASFAGLDMDAAWALVQARFAGVTPGCGDGFAGADCALGELLADDLCGATPIDAALLALYESKIGKARAVLARASAGGKPGKVRRLLRKTVKHLKVLDRRTRKARDMDEGCRSTLGGLLETRRQQVLALGG